MRTFGFNEHGTAVREDEAAILREAATRLLREENPETIRAITADYRQRGVIGTKGKLMTAVALKRLLTSPRMIGMKKGAGGALEPTGKPAILDRTTYDRLVELLTDPARHIPGSGGPRRYLLVGGLAVCGLCGTPLSASPSSFGKRGYACRPPAGCDRIRIAAEGLETDVAERVLARFASPKTRARLRAAADPGQARAEITRAQGKLAELARMWADNAIDTVSYQAARKDLTDRIKGLERHAAAAEALAGIPADDEADPKDLAQWWVDAGIEQRVDLVKVVLDHVVVGKVTRPGFTGFDEGRVTYVWR